jgi:mRNA-degrading endonuclease toxin of MazEF toxin-antitoxin module
MPRIAAGSIVVGDRRGDALPKEPNKARPAVVLEDHGLFAAGYPNVIVVPLTDDEGLAIPELPVAIDPTPENGCDKRCFAPAPFVTSASLSLVRESLSRISQDQLRRIRREIAFAFGMD